MVFVPPGRIFEMLQSCHWYPDTQTAKRMQGKSGKLPGTFVLLLSSTVRELAGSCRRTSGEVARELPGKSGTSGEVRGLSQKLRNESIPKSKFWGRISGRRPTRISRWTSGGKNFSQALEILEKQTFGADIHDPKARMSMSPGGSKIFMQENFGLNFVPLKLGEPDSLQVLSVLRSGGLPIQTVDS